MRQDFAVSEGPLGDLQVGGNGFDYGGDLRVWVGGTVAFFVAIPAGTGLLAVAAHFNQFVCDRQLAVVRVDGCPAFAGLRADVEAGQVTHRERAHWVAEINHYFVDLFSQAAFLQQDDHL